MRLESDLFDVLKEAAEGRLRDVKLQWKTDTSGCGVLSSKGYPGP
jgi:phosphoribosylamine-glycine ligase